MGGKQGNLFGGPLDAKEATDFLLRQEPELLGYDISDCVGNTVDDVSGFLEKGKDEQTGIYLFLCSACGSESQDSINCSTCGFSLHKPEYCPPYKGSSSYFSDPKSTENIHLELSPLQVNSGEPIKKRIFTKHFLDRDLFYDGDSFQQDEQGNVSLVFKLSEDSIDEFIIEGKINFQGKKNIEGQSKTAVHMTFTNRRFTLLKNGIKIKSIRKTQFPPASLQRLESIIKGKSRVI